ncbi:MAG: hypothetical protein JXA14_22885 [Anaerolineae bacterium]|nr:hypothetical protein [Anaerolineae bacterium]
MDSDDRVVVEGPLYQGEDEGIYYSITTTPWGSSPTNVSVVVKDVHQSYEDVTDEVMPSGSPSVDGDVITLPKLRNLERNHWYVIEVKFTVSGNDLEAIIPVVGQR